MMQTAERFVGYWRITKMEPCGTACRDLLVPAFIEFDRRCGRRRRKDDSGSGNCVLPDLIEVVGPRYSLGGGSGVETRRPAPSVLPRRSLFCESSATPQSGVFARAWSCHMDNAASLPLMLSGCQVLDFTQYLAGPTVTRLMAEMGAQIIKVEQAPMGDPSRLLPFVKNGRSAYFVQQNRGKKSLCLDFNKPEALDLLYALAATMDVIVENYGPGVMEKRGLDYASLKKRNPKVIMVSVSAFGRNSPLSHKVGYDLIAQAFSGLMHMTGPADGPPQAVGLGMADVSSGVHAFAALGYALYYREKTGVGQHIDLAMVDALYHMHEVNVQAYTGSEGQYVPMRAGSHHPLVCPCGTFKGPQGWIVVLVLDRQWPSLTQAMGK